MENLTNKIITLDEEEKYLILRQAVYKGKTYYLGAGLNKDTEEFNNEDMFFEEVTDEDGDKAVLKLTDTEIIKVLVENIDLFKDEE